jgi:hypothetical protein
MELRYKPRLSRAEFLYLIIHISDRGIDEVDHIELAEIHGYIHKMELQDDTPS